MFEPTAETVPDIRPLAAEPIQRKVGIWTNGQPPVATVRRRDQTVEPHAFPMVDVTESTNDIDVRDAKVAIELLVAEGRATLQETLIGPCRTAGSVQEQLAAEAHAASISPLAGAPATTCVGIR